MRIFAVSRSRKTPESFGIRTDRSAAADRFWISARFPVGDAPHRAAGSNRKSQDSGHRGRLFTKSRPSFGLPVHKIILLKKGALWNEQNEQAHSGDASGIRHDGLNEYFGAGGE